MGFHLLDSLKLFIKSNYFLFKASRYPLIWMHYFEKKRDFPVDDFWKDRINIALSAPDNLEIARVSNAGKIEGDTQIMHNGVKIHVGSYYGNANTVLLYKNKGVHEPEEEKCFEQIIDLMPPGACMLELGAFWGFYSMAFQRKVTNAKNYLIEPDKHAILSGKNNFKLNNFKGEFFRYFISDKAEHNATPSISVDVFLQRQHIPHLNILHSDIQGFELKMLQGSVESFQKRIIDYLFISTHSNELHDDCKSLIEQSGYKILCDTNIDQTYSWDGLIVARRTEISGPDTIHIHKRPC